MSTLPGPLAATGTVRTAPLRLDSIPIVLRGITIRACRADDHPEAGEEWFARQAHWLRADDIRD